MTMDWQGAPASPSSFTVKRILQLEIPVDTYPNVSSLNKCLSTCFLKMCYKTLICLVSGMSVQFCWAASWTQRQFSETGGSYYRMSCVY